MKAIVFLISFFVFNVSIPNNVTKSSIPDDIEIGETIQNVEKCYPNYHFKFYKYINCETKGEKELATFAMLGYWNKDEGCVLLFTNDTFIASNQFKKINDYEEYITNPDENQNIQIIADNLIK